jgi:CubicO group peptidase (beta-lactamase class C family)
MVVERGRSVLITTVCPLGGSLVVDATAPFALPPKGVGIGSSSTTAFGHPGAGGSIGFADPDAHLGFGYTMNQIQAAIPPDPRALRLIDALYASL